MTESLPPLGDLGVSRRQPCVVALGSLETAVTGYQRSQCSTVSSPFRAAGLNVVPNV
jgi:hypothetical protein